MEHSKLWFIYSTKWQLPWGWQGTRLIRATMNLSVNTLANNGYEVLTTLVVVVVVPWHLQVLIFFFSKNKNLVKEKIFESSGIPTFYLVEMKKFQNK
jgi:hypothetical protein